MAGLGSSYRELEQRDVMMSILPLLGAGKSRRILEALESGYDLFVLGQRRPRGVAAFDVQETR
jgi:hypothetical protein